MLEDVGRATADDSGATDAGAADVQPYDIEPPLPVYRYGCLVSAAVGGKPHALDSKAADKAMALFDQDKDLFEAIIRQAMAETFEGTDRFIDESDGKRLKRKGVAPQEARRSEGLGAIYDFAEILIWLDGKLARVRVCLTACVDDKLFAGRGTKQTFSKLWVRVIWVKEVEPASAATDLRNFRRRTDLLARAILKALLSPYEKVLREVTEIPTLSVSLPGDAFSVLTLSVSRSPGALEFPALFAATKAGKRLRDNLGNQTARQLLKLGETVLEDREETGTWAKGRVPKDVEYIAYDGSLAFRGLFLARRTKDLREFVGLAQGPIKRGASKSTEPPPWENSANVVSGGVVSELGSYY